MIIACGYSHPELVSGSIMPFGKTVPEARWMLKQVQHDGCENLSAHSAISARDNIGFAQRRKDAETMDCHHSLSEPVLLRRQEPRALGSSCALWVPASAGIPTSRDRRG